MAPTRVTPGADDSSVLVIEENVPLGSLLQTLLRRRGFAVEWVAGGAEATERTDLRVYDAIVLDLMSPGANGFQLLDALGRRKLLGRTVVTTAVSEASAEAVRPRVFAVVKKPFENDDFVAVVSRCVARSKQSSPAGGGGLRKEIPIRTDERDPETGSGPGMKSAAAARRMTMLAERV